MCSVRNGTNGACKPTHITVQSTALVGVSSLLSALSRGLHEGNNPKGLEKWVKNLWKTHNIGSEGDGKTAEIEQTTVMYQ